MEREKREEARRLRREEGMAITEISRVLKASKGSISVWVRDIELTAEQQEKLDIQHYARPNHVKGSHTNAVKARELRRQYQEEGRTKAREGDPLHIAGCMLYWGEGAKKRNVLGLSNSDPSLMKFYVQFLKESLFIKTDEISLRIYCYLGNETSQDEIEQFWLTTLELPKSCLKTVVINPQPKSSQQKGRKLAYGVGVVDVFSTRFVQHVFGAIQEYAGIDKPEWLM